MTATKVTPEQYAAMVAREAREANAGRLTFAAFQATRRWCDDLRPYDVICADTDTRPPRGWLYLSSNYITQVEEWWPNNVRDEGQWHLQLSRDETVSDDLEALERELFQWAVMEGYDQDDARNALIAQYEAWNAEHGLKLGSADEHTMDDSITEPQRAWLRDFCARWDAMEHGVDESEPAPSPAPATVVLTVVCHEEGTPSNVLIYTVMVPRDYTQAMVARAVERERAMDIDTDEDIAMEVLFAFKGDVHTTADWRE